MGSRFPDDVGIPTIDLAKIRFQHSDAASNGMCNRKVTHPKLERFLDSPFAQHGRDGSLLDAPHCGRVALALAACHEARPIEPTCESRSRARENDDADTEAIAEAVRQPGMRFAVPKSLDRLAAAISQDATEARPSSRKDGEQHAQPAVRVRPDRARGPHGDGSIDCRWFRKDRVEKFAIDIVLPYRQVFNQDHDPIVHDKFWGIDREPMRATRCRETIVCN